MDYNDFDQLEDEDMGYFFQGPKGAYVLIDYIVSTLAIIGNILALDTVRQVRFGLCGYRFFLISLICSDLYLCCINIITFFLPIVNNLLDKCSADYVRIFQIVGFLANLFNLCGMSIDHYIGILHPLRYRDIMRKRTVITVIIIIWIISISIGSIDIFLVAGNIAIHWIRHKINSPSNEENDLAVTIGSLPPEDSSSVDDRSAAIINTLKQMLETQASHSKPLNNQGSIVDSHDLDEVFQMIKNYSSDSDILTDVFPLPESEAPIITILQKKAYEDNWCIAKQDNSWLEFLVMTLTAICFLFLIACYGRIFKEVFSNLYGHSERNIRRLVYTTIFLLGSFIMCWMPFMTFEFSMIVLLHTNFNINDHGTLKSSATYFALHNAFNTLLMCSPLLDPIIYAARMRIIRETAMFRYGSLFPCFGSYLSRLKEQKRSSSCSKFLLNKPPKCDETEAFATFGPNNEVKYISNGQSRLQTQRFRKSKYSSIKHADKTGNYKDGHFQENNNYGSCLTENCFTNRSISSVTLATAIDGSIGEESANSLYLKWREYIRYMLWSSRHSPENSDDCRQERSPYSDEAFPRSPQFHEMKTDLQPISHYSPSDLISNGSIDLGSPLVSPTSVFDDHSSPLFTTQNVLDRFYMHSSRLLDWFSEKPYCEFEGEDLYNDCPNDDAIDKDTDDSGEESFERYQEECIETTIDSDEGVVSSSLTHYTASEIFKETSEYLSALPNIQFH